MGARGVVLLRLRGTQQLFLAVPTTLPRTLGQCQGRPPGRSVLASLPASRRALPAASCPACGPPSGRQRAQEPRRWPQLARPPKLTGDGHRPRVHFRAGQALKYSLST